MQRTVAVEVYLLDVYVQDRMPRLDPLDPGLDVLGERDPFV